MTWEIGERAKTLWRQAPAICRLPEVFRKYGVEVDGEPFKKLAQYVAAVEDYFWDKLSGRREGCVVDVHSVRNTYIYEFRCNLSIQAADLLTHAAKTLFESLSDTQRQWLLESGEKILIGFELADAGLTDTSADLNTTDTFNVLLYAVLKYATGKKVRHFYIPTLTLTKKGARLKYHVSAEPSLNISKKELYSSAERGLPPPRYLQKAAGPAMWLGLLLGDGVIWGEKVGISTAAPSLLHHLLPPALIRTYSKNILVLSRAVVDIVVKHAEPATHILDALAETFRNASPIEPKWLRLRRLAAKRRKRWTYELYFELGLHHLIGELRKSEEDFKVFRRLEEDAVVYIYFVKSEHKWHGLQARFKRIDGKWKARVHSRDIYTLKKLREKLGRQRKIRKTGKIYEMTLYTIDML